MQQPEIASIPAGLCNQSCYVHISLLCILKYNVKPKSALSTFILQVPAVCGTLDFAFAGIELVAPAACAQTADHSSMKR